MECGILARTWRGRCIASTLGAVCLVVSGCGATQQSNESVMASSRLDVSVYAHKVNLRASDVPAFVRASFPPARATAGGPFGTAVEKCDGVIASGDEVAGVTSNRFKDARREHTGGSGFPIYTVQSAVYVLHSPALARREVAAAMSHHGQECIKQSILSTNPSITPEGAKTGEPALSNVDIASVTLRVLGQQAYESQTTAHTVTAEARRDGTPNFHQNLFAFVVGQSIVTLQTVGSPSPFSQTKERRLLSLLYRRAVKAAV